MEREYQRTSLFCTRKTHRPPSSRSEEAGPAGAAGSLAKEKGCELQKGCGRDPGDGEAVWREEMAVRSPRGPQTLTHAAEGRSHIHLAAHVPSPGRGSPREGTQEEGRPCALSVLQGRGQHSRPRASTSHPPAPLTPKSAGRGPVVRSRTPGTLPLGAPTCRSDRPLPPPHYPAASRPSFRLSSQASPTQPQCLSRGIPSRKGLPGLPG